MMKQRHYDVSLTEGTVWKALLLFFVPIFLGAFVQQLYSLADAVILGRFAGKAAFGAVDAIGNLIKLPLNFFLGLSAGASVVISQYYGAGNSQKLSAAVRMTAVVTLFCALAVTVLGIALAPFMLQSMNTPEDMYPNALSYLRISYAGVLFSLTYNMGAGILRAVGDSKRPFYYLMVCCALNIVLDLIFVALLHWEAAGAALGTISSQAVSAVLVCRTIAKDRTAFGRASKRKKSDRPVLSEIVRLGLPLGVQSALYPVANLIIQSAINSHGTDAVAAWGVCGKLDLIIWMLMDALGVTVSTFVAQNYGAGKPERVKQGVRACFLLALAATVPLCVMLFFFSEPLGHLFIRDDGVVALSTHLMRWFMAPFYVTYLGGEIYSGAIRGTGESFRPMLLTLLCTCALRVVWIFCVVRLCPNSLDAVIASFPVSWIVNSLAFAIYYSHREQLRNGAPAD